jgi:hypothetical protein
MPDGQSGRDRRYVISPFGRDDIEDEMTWKVKCRVRVCETHNQGVIAVM